MAHVVTFELSKFPELVDIKLRAGSENTKAEATQRHHLRQIIQQ